MVFLLLQEYFSLSLCRSLVGGMCNAYTCVFVSGFTDANPFHVTFHISFSTFGSRFLLDSKTSMWRERERKKDDDWFERIEDTRRMFNVWESVCVTLTAVMWMEMEKVKIKMGIKIDCYDDDLVTFVVAWKKGNSSFEIERLNFTLC